MRGGSFDTDKLFLMPLAQSSGLRAGAQVFVSSDADSATISDQLMGRVVSATGEPIDGIETKIFGDRRPIIGYNINPMEKAPIQRKLDVGKRPLTRS